MSSDARLLTVAALYWLAVYVLYKDKESAPVTKTVTHLAEIHSKTTYYAIDFS